MKFIDEYRNQKAVKILADRINLICRNNWTIMEVCGGQTHNIMKFGLEELLPEKIDLLHGPGCPVCVTPVEYIDKAIMLSSNPDVILVTYGDMLRVPGSRKDLLSAKAEGNDIRIIYSPVDAIKIAEYEANKKIVFFAVGFETTAPPNAMAVLTAKKKRLKNFFMLSSHVLIPPAIELLLSSKSVKIQGLLAPGHVCTITGLKDYQTISQKYNIPISITGFEPTDILHGILSVVEMLESGLLYTDKVMNQYARSVKPEGNIISQKILEEVFDIVDRKWRGIGIIPGSGLKLNKEFSEFDAENHFALTEITAEESSLCVAGKILQGIKKPGNCSAFGKECTPEKPLGAPMVSSEGVCAAYYRYKNLLETK